MSIWMTIGLIVLSQLILTLVLRTFPDFVGSALTKSLEHRFDLKLEKAKAEMQSAYSTLKTSVDFLSAGQAEHRLRTINAVEKLWNAILAVKEEFRDIVFVHMVMTPDEIGKVVQADPEHRLLGAAAKYRHEEHLHVKMDRIDRLAPEGERLFCGDRLWLIFFVTRAFCGRIGALMHISIIDRVYIDWREDEGVASQLMAIIPPTIITEAKQKPFFGVPMLLSYLEAEFLKEARRIMSGSQGLADSLSDIQAIVKVEHEKVAEATRERCLEP
jgi:hypothetical protein